MPVAFQHCTSLTAVTIPETVLGIAKTAFEDCGDVTIYGWSGSCAEAFAKSNDIPFRVLDPQAGDLNRDGQVNLKDVVLLRRYIAGGWDVEL